MELVEGATLAQTIAQRGAGAEITAEHCRELAQAFAGAADGLQHAHAKGVVHRDIKPSNLIFDAEGRLRILDFGLARMEGQESITVSGDLVGTVLYMSPEQARRRQVPVDHRTDIYSLGAALYEAIAGQPPFRGRDTTDTLSQIIERDPPPLCRGNPRVPEVLETIVLKCLRKDPLDRYHTAEALAQDLRRFLRGDDIEARPQGTWEKAWRRVWRRRAAIGVGLLVTVLIAALGVVVVSWRRADLARLQTEYETLVRQAALRLELASIAQKGRAGGPGVRLIIEDTHLLTPAAVDPAALALRDLEHAIVLDAGRADARYYRVSALLYLGRPDEARPALDELTGARSPFVPALTLKADLLERGGDAAAAASARELARKAALEPWETSWIEVEEAWKSDDHAGAIEAYDRLLEATAAREPFVGCALLARRGRGFAWKALDKHGEALMDFAIVGSLAPGALEPAIFQAEALYRLGRKEEAESLVQRAFRSTARKDEVALAIAGLYATLEDEAQLFAWLDSVPNESVREGQRAWVFHDRGRFAEAKAAARKAITLDATNAEGYVVLAFLYNNTERRSDLAARAMEEARRYQPRSWMVLHFLGWSLVRSGRLREAIPVLEEAVPLALNPAGTLGWIANAHYALGEEAEGDEWARRAWERAPGSQELGVIFSSYLTRIGRLDDAVAAGRRVEPHGYTLGNMALARLSQGRHDEALALCREARAVKPLRPQPFLFAAHIQHQRGNRTAALGELGDLFEAVEISSQAHGWLNALVRDHGRELEPAAVEKALQALEKVAEEKPREPWLLFNSLARLQGCLPGETHAAGAIASVLDGLDAAEPSGGFVIELGETLREIIAARTAAGACVLDVLPRLPTFGGIDALFEAEDPVLPGACTAASVEAWSPAAAGDAGAGVEASAADRRSYLLARLHLAQGRPAEAAAAVRELAAREGGRPEPLILLGSAHSSAGQPQAAEEALRSVLAAAPERHRRLWDAWLDVCFAALKLTPAEVLDKLPPAPPREVAPPGSFLGELDAAEKAGQRADYLADVRWLLGELAAGRSVRINCGGGDLTLPDGEVWGRDRFFVNGAAWLWGDIDVRGTERDDLYRRSRMFWSMASAADGYVLPLPPGRYRVHLHFAETHMNCPGTRRFDVTLQGRAVLEGFEVLAGAPFRTALEKVVETELQGGPLEIRFPQGLELEGPLIAAIEVERVE